MADGGSTKAVCSATLKDGMMNIHFDRDIPLPSIAMALRLLNKQFDKMLEQKVMPEKPSIVQAHPDIVNRIRGGK
jgi:hypothetical protein